MNETSLTPDLFHGLAELESTARGRTPHRLPAWVRRQFPDGQLMSMEAQPSGVRIVFRTAATALELVTHAKRVAYRGADRPRGGIDTFVDGVRASSDELTGGDVLEVDLLTGAMTPHGGPDHTTRLTLPGRDARVEIWLPHNESIEIIALRADAPLRPDIRIRPTWIHYGSSISQGSNAIMPSEIWPAIAARSADVDLRNLGFGGSAFVAPFIARLIRDTPANLISVKIGINVVNLDAMRLRTFVPAVHGFLDTIRDGHPDTPLLLISPLFAGIHEDTPGPGAIDPASIGSDQVRFIATGTRGDTANGRLTLRVVREALHDVVGRRTDDANLHFIEGTDLYGEEDAAALPLLDGLHPSPEAHRLIGERFSERVFGPGGSLRQAQWPSR
ncbi:SGNH/GDSL hydrolase family protein [Microbacterium sp. C448]|uniref:SGNH/GDSL hydrolase family protein n=1 Tax=Microbacterium sp. C448 TaxID=1177594 RepID=UPI0004B8788F|nr:SGNH/GDSL hydrolase family protein [Microbacterium sp. C448]